MIQSRALVLNGERMSYLKVCDELGVGNVVETVRAYYDTHGRHRKYMPEGSNWLVFVCFTK
jgi:hypothetical protein